MGDGVGGAGSEREVSGEREPEGGQVQAVTGVAVKGGGGGGGPPPGGGVTGGGSEDGSFSQFGQFGSDSSRWSGLPHVAAGGVQAWAWWAGS